MSTDIFVVAGQEHLPIGENARLLRGFSHAIGSELLHDIATVTGQAAFRQMRTPGGYTMSAAMSNCGELGWVADTRGYRYTDV
ncbi:MAG: alpha-ketoglutarate-dependent dioxygenase AlkB, partial [Gammaproteobacteria bacterium]